MKGTCVSEMVGSKQDRRLWIGLIINTTWHKGTWVSEMVGSIQDRKLWSGFITNTPWHGL